MGDTHTTDGFREPPSPDSRPFSFSGGTMDTNELDMTAPSCTVTIIDNTGDTPDNAPEEGHRNG